LENLVILRIVDNDGVALNGVKLRSASEVTQALEKIAADKADMIISVEATDSKWYESIGMAIYGIQRAGFLDGRYRVLIDGQPLEL